MAEPHHEHLPERRVVPRAPASSSRVLWAVAFVLVLLVSACATPIAAPARSAIDPVSPPTPIPPTPTPVPAVAVEEDPDSAATPEPTPEPIAGLSESRIRLATVIDVSTGGVGSRPFESAREAIDAWVLAVNQRGGIAGRDVVVDHLGETAATHGDALAAACEGDYFALVGSLSWTDGDGIAQIDTDDCLLPDFPAVATSSTRRTSRVTFLSNPSIDEYYVASFRNRLDNQADSASNSMVIGVESGLGIAETFRVYEAAEAVGYIFPTEERFQRLNPEADFSKLGEYVMGDQPDALLWAADPGRLADLLIAVDELEDQDPFDFVICTRGCYDQAFVDAVGAAGNNVYASIPHLPFEEQGLDPGDLRSYLSWLALSKPNAVPSSDGVAAWAAGRLFEEAVNRTVNAGPNQDLSLLTPEAVVDAAATIEVWNARRLYGDASPALRQPTPCQVVMRLSDGEWERVRPVTAGSRDCELENLVFLQATAGISAPAAETSSITSGADDSDVGEDPLETTPGDPAEPSGSENPDPLEQIEELPE